MSIYSANFAVGLVVRSIDVAVSKNAGKYSKDISLHSKLKYVQVNNGVIQPRYLRQRRRDI